MFSLGLEGFVRAIEGFGKIKGLILAIFVSERIVDEFFEDYVREIVSEILSENVSENVSEIISENVLENVSEIISEINSENVLDGSHSGHYVVCIDLIVRICVDFHLFST